MPISDNLVRYFSLDEASGDAIDAHSAKNLTETGGTIASVSGVVSTARDFELGDTEYFTTTDESDLRAGNTNFTWAGWVNVETRNGDNSVLGKWDGGSNSEYLLWFGGGDSINWSLLQAVGGVVTLSPDLAGNGTNHFIVVWHDADNNQSGISLNNGTPTTTAIDGGGIVSATLAFGLGAATGGTSFFDGVLDEWGFWRRVLTADDRTYLYNGGAGRSYSEIVGGVRRWLLTRTG